MVRWHALRHNIWKISTGNVRSWIILSRFLIWRLIYVPNNIKFLESRTRDITAYVHSTDVNEFGPLPPDAQICGSHPGHVDDGAIITFQCKPPMYVIISISFSKECTCFCLMILMEYNFRFGRHVTLRRGPGMTAPLNLGEVEVYKGIWAFPILNWKIHLQSHSTGFFHKVSKIKECQYCMYWQIEQLRFLTRRICQNLNLFINT